MIIIPSQFIIPFFILMGAIILVCAIIMIVNKRGSTHERNHVRVIAKSQEQIKGMAKGTMRNITIFETLDTAKEIKMVLPPGIHETVIEGETGQLEYTAIRGNPAFFKGFVSDRYAR